MPPISTPPQKPTCPRPPGTPAEAERRLRQLERNVPSASPAEAEDRRERFELLWERHRRQWEQYDGYQQQSLVARRKARRESLARVRYNLTDRSWLKRNVALLLFIVVLNLLASYCGVYDVPDVPFNPSWRLP